MVRSATTRHVPRRGNREVKLVRRRAVRLDLREVAGPGSEPVRTPGCAAFEREVLERVVEDGGETSGVLVLNRRCELPVAGADPLGCRRLGCRRVGKGQKQHSAGEGSGHGSHSGRASGTGIRQLNRRRRARHLSNPAAAPIGESSSLVRAVDGCFDESPFPAEAPGVLQPAGGVTAGRAGGCFID